jgi:patatin-like phospholipase/acyl hydrolase
MSTAQQSTTHAAPDNERRLCLLSLDGGGVRGLSSLVILEELMRKIDPTNPPKPCDYFDMMGGTSTGGLIAIMLGRLEMSIKDCREAYRVLSNDVFQQKNYIAEPWFNMPWNWHIKGRFDSDALKKGIKKIIVQELKKRRSSAGKTDEELENTLLHDENAKCKVLVIRVLEPMLIS